jgi:hypothetical protein
MTFREKLLCYHDHPAKVVVDALVALAVAVLSTLCPAATDRSTSTARTGCGLPVSPAFGSDLCWFKTFAASPSSSS